MNVNFLGPYIQNDGWGIAAKNYLKALTYVDCDLTITPMQYSQMVDAHREGFISFLKEGEPGGEICIQNVIPPGEKDLGKKNVWLGYTETRHSAWYDMLDNFDAYIVPTPLEKKYMEEHGIENVHVVEMPIDFSVLENISLEKDERLSENFIFYTIGEWNWRKNFEPMILAYWREFSKKDDVKLLIKTRAGNTHQKRLEQAFLSYINQLRAKYRIHEDADYPEIYVVTEYLRYEDILRLHYNCDCLVVPSRGESTFLPMIDALFYNKDVICTSNIGCVKPWMKEEIREVNSFEVPCDTSTPPIKNIYTGKETCRMIDVLDLQKHMREAYESKTGTNCKQELIAHHCLDTAAKALDNVLRGLCVR